MIHLIDTTANCTEKSLKNYWLLKFINRCVSTYLSKIQETSKLSTSAGSIFNSVEMNGMAMRVYGRINLINTCVRILRNKSEMKRIAWNFLCIVRMTTEKYLQCALWWIDRPWCCCDSFSKSIQTRWCRYFDTILLNWSWPKFPDRFCMVLLLVNQMDWCPTSSTYNHRTL